MEIKLTGMASGSAESGPSVDIANDSSLLYLQLLPSKVDHSVSCDRISARTRAGRQRCTSSTTSTTLLTGPNSPKEMAAASGY